MAIKNFLQKLIKNLSQDVFRPIPTGLLYTILQAIEREIAGECPWDTGDECYLGYNQFWTPACRNIKCPGYRNPHGLIAYTSRSSSASSVDNRFDFSSFRYRSGNGDDWILVGTLGAMVKFDFGLFADPGGYGAGFFGYGYYGFNAVIPGSHQVEIGDKWYITCHTASTVTGTDGKTYQCKVKHTSGNSTRPVTGGDWENVWTEGGLNGNQWQSGVVYDVQSVVEPAIAEPGNKGIYNAIATIGPYSGDHDTIYTVEIIDFWAYQQNFKNAILQISLATCTEEWLDYWGDYFGIPRLLLRTATGVFKGYEDDETYRARIMKEITRAKGTRAVLWEEAVAFFNSDRVTVEEYYQQGAQSVVLGTDGEAVTQSVVLGTDKKFYSCINTHVASTVSKPITGANWKLYWRLGGSGGGVWVDGLLYLSGGKFYKCIQTHLSTTSNRPTTGANWRTYWVQGGDGGNSWIEGTTYIAGWTPRWDGPVLENQSFACPFYGVGSPSKGLWPFEFYINIPAQRAPSAKFVKNGDVPRCRCEEGYGASPCFCDSTVYNATPAVCNCDSSCYGHGDCACDISCYGYQHLCDCDSACYGYNACSCNATCYAEACGCNATCYSVSSNYCSCFATCYAETCVCDSSCYGYTACSCNAVCYNEGHSCACNYANYGYHSCICDATCYTQGCSCNAACYGHSCTCDATFYEEGDRCGCYNTCYLEVSCSCDVTCYLHTCACDVTNYGEVPCTCEAMCYGEQTGSCTCNAMCYGDSPCVCDSTCYAFATCECDSACYGYGACLCDGSCYGYMVGSKFKLPYGEFGSYTYEAGSGYYYGYGTFAPIVLGTKIFSEPVNLGDSLLIGNERQFSGVYFKWITPGVGGNYTWEYWNGIGWTTLTFRDQNTSPVSGEENVDRLRQNGWVHWLEGLTGWAKADNIPYNIPNTGIQLYWVRCRVTSVPSITPVVDNFWITYAGQTCRGHYIAHGIDICRCDATCYGDRPCTCDSLCYGDQPCSCDITCYGDLICSCDVTNYGYSGCSCDSTCYDYTSCSCNVSCYTQGCGCNATCYYVTSSFCYCFWTCYQQSCSCDAQCYGYTGCSCDLACYGYSPCACDAACYGYHDCDCNAVCYGFGTCACESTCYGYYGCSCDSTCYGQNPATYDPTKRDKNNCYIYWESSFSKPHYESGLQEILDRLKTAGTIAIINPLD